MDTSTTVMMIAAVVTLVAVYWKSPAAASMGVRFAVSFSFPFLTGWLCEILWEKLRVLSEL
jgi:hypothetical protein